MRGVVRLIAAHEVGEDLNVAAEVLTKAVDDLLDAFTDHPTVRRPRDVAQRPAPLPKLEGETAEMDVDDTDIRLLNLPFPVKEIGHGEGDLDLDGILPSRLSPLYVGVLQLRDIIRDLPRVDLDASRAGDNIDQHAGSGDCRTCLFLDLVHPNSGPAG